MAGRRLSYTEEEAREAIAASYSWAESLRRLGLCPSGGGWRVLRKHVAVWNISTAHFDPSRARAGNLGAKRPLAQVLVSGSTFSRSHLKQRLFREGIKEPRCEMCGQDENWNGRPMSMILDHINGVRDDHRLENLRIVCPNCAATLPTHCGRSRECGVRWDRSRFRGVPKPTARKVERPPYEKLMSEIETSSYLAVGRKYGVSDNAVRKWVRFYEREAERVRSAG